MDQVDVNWWPRFQPPVELLLLPPSLLLSLFLRTNATFLPSVICSADSPSGPWRTPPLQPVHSWRRPVYTALIGSALDWPCDLPAPHTPAFSLSTLFLFYTRILSSPLFAPPIVQISPPLCGSLEHPQWDGGGGGGVVLLCRRTSSRDVNQSWFLQAFLK